MSKAAMRSLTHTAAQEWGPSGVTVNAYAPGAVDTNLRESIKDITSNSRPTMNI